MQYKKVPWIDGTNIYEVNIRQYTPEGTFAAFEQHLPRLKDMGVQILWLMPITPISLKERLGGLGSYYACSSYTAVNPEFGTINDFKNLVNKAHELGFKLIIDWVANHTGWDHHWATEHPDWYIKDADGKFTDTNGWKDVIDLNYGSKEMRQALIDAMKFWVNECGIDGFRCDMAHLVPLDFWKDARTQCDRVKTLFWLAECEVIEYHEVFDVTYAWEWMHVSEKTAKQIASLQHLKDVYDKYAQYPDDAKKLYFTSNHDENSWNGTEYEKYGNGARAFAVCCCTLPGMPLLYSGQELPNYKRLSFFDKDQIDWNKSPALHNFYKQLFELRKSNKSFQKSPSCFILHTNADNKIFAYLLVNGESKVLVLLNLSPDDRIGFTIEHKSLASTYKSLFSGLFFTLKSNEQFELMGWEYVVYHTEA